MQTSDTKKTIRRNFFDDYQRLIALSRQERPKVKTALMSRPADAA